MSEIRGVKDMRVGDVFSIRAGGTITILEIVNGKNITIQHNDKYGHTVNTSAYVILLGSLKNPYAPVVLGVGFLGVGIHRCRINGKITPEYQAWAGMLQRCHDLRYQSRQPTYVGCTIHDEWYNFQIFAKWYTSQVCYNMGYELDKDLLCINNKHYSPDTCTLLPSNINSLIRDYTEQYKRALPTGVVMNGSYYAAQITIDGNHIYLGTYRTVDEASIAYVTARNDHMNNLVLKYKDIIEPRAYNALLRYATT